MPNPSGELPSASTHAIGSLDMPIAAHVPAFVREAARLFAENIHQPCG